MGVSRRPGGKWRAQVETPAGQRTKQFDLKRDADRWFAEQKTLLARGEFVDPRRGKVTFTEFFDDWATRQLWELGTQRAMSLAVRSVTFGDIQLAKIRRAHVEEWVKAMSLTLAPGTVNTRFNNVGNVLRAAVRDQHIGRNPAEGVTLPRQRRREHTLVLPTVEQVHAVLEIARPDFRTFVSLCAFAGLRLGEASGVQVRDLDVANRRLRISRQIQRINGSGIEVRQPKFGSERVVFVPAQLVSELVDHIDDRVSADEPRWLFRGEGADPPHQNSIGYLWRKTIRDAGIEGIRLHDLRHFYASGLIAAGCDVVTVSRALGHARPTTTLNQYSHLWPSAEDRTRDAASRLMSGTTRVT